MLFSKILLEKGHQTNIQHHSILKQQKNISLQLTLSLLAIHNTYTLLHDNDIHLLKLMYFSRFWQKIYQVYHYLKEISKRKKKSKKNKSKGMDWLLNLLQSIFKRRRERKVVENKLIFSMTEDRAMWPTIYIRENSSIDSRWLYIRRF